MVFPNPYINFTYFIRLHIVECLHVSVLADAFNLVSSICNPRDYIVKKTKVIQKNKPPRYPSTTKKHVHKHTYAKVIIVNHI